MKDRPQHVRIPVGEPHEVDVVPVLPDERAERPPLERGDLEVDPHVTEAGLHRLRHGLVARAADDREVDHQFLAALLPDAVAPRLPAGFIEDLPGLGRVEAVDPLGGRIVPERRPHQGTPGHLVEAVEDGFVQPLAVDREGDRPADGQRADRALARHVEEQHEPRSRLPPLDHDEPRVVPEAGVLERIQVVDVLCFAGLERPGPHGPLRDDLEHHLVEQRRPLVLEERRSPGVRGVPDERDVIFGHPLLDHERARPHRVSGEVREPHLLDRGGRDDPQVPVQVGQQGSVPILHDDLDRGVVDDLGVVVRPELVV